MQYSIYGGPKAVAVGQMYSVKSGVSDSWRLWQRTFYTPFQMVWWGEMPWEGLGLLSRRSPGHIFHDASQEK